MAMDLRMSHGLVSNSAPNNPGTVNEQGASNVPSSAPSSFTAKDSVG